MEEQIETPVQEEVKEQPKKEGHFCDWCRQIFPIALLGFEAGKVSMQLCEKCFRVVEKSMAMRHMEQGIALDKINISSK